MFSTCKLFVLSIILIILSEQLNVFMLIMLTAINISHFKYNFTALLKTEEHLMDLHFIKVK